MPGLESFLGLDRLTVTQEEEITDDYGHPMKVLTCESTGPRPACPHCGGRNVYANTTRPKMIRDIDAAGYRITLKIMARNYKCNVCGKYYTEEVDIASPGARSTKRFTKEIGEKALNNTFDSIGAEYGMSPSTVSAVFRDWVNSRDDDHFDSMRCPRVLGIDEAHLCPEGHTGPDDGMRGIFVDVENSKIIDITRDRYKATVISWLKHIRDNDNLEIVTMDMWDGYRQAVYEVFGDRVKVVIDRFHVIQELISQMQKCRNNIYDHLPEGSLRNHKNNLSLLKTNLEDLDDEMKRQLNRLFVVAPDIKLCYGLKESFRSIYRCETRAQAEEAFERWAASIPNNDDFKPFKSMVKTVRKYHKEIFNFFECERVTNAITESLNSIVKKINRFGNGYSFDVLRAKILFGAGRRAYVPIGTRTTSTETSASDVPEDAFMYKKFDSTHMMNSFFVAPKSKKTIMMYGVDIDWLTKEVESGDFFRRDLPSASKNKQPK